MVYLLDTDVFIRSKNDHYSFGLCPGFWDWLIYANEIGRVYSIDAVLAELTDGEDELSTWAREHKEMFLSVSEGDIAAIAAVNRWANDSPDYEPVAKADFANAADSFLIGQARARQYVVVSHERISDSRRKIKIPNAASKLGVRCVNTFQMLRAEKARFVLDGPSAPSLGQMSLL